MLGALLLQCELGLLLASIYSCLYLVMHYLSHNLRDCLCSRWMYQYGTLVTLLFKALSIHFEYHWYFCLLNFILYCHYHLSFFTLSVVCCSMPATCWIAQLDCSCLDCPCSLCSGPRFSLVAVASLPPLVCSPCMPPTLYDEIK